NVSNSRMSSSLVDEAWRLDVRFELARERAAYEERDLRRHLECLADHRRDLTLPASPRFDMEMQHVVAAQVVDLGAKVDHVGVAEYRVLELGVVDVHAAHLEEADRAARMPHDGKHRPRLLAAGGRRERHEVA